MWSSYCSDGVCVYYGAIHIANCHIIDFFSFLFVALPILAVLPIRIDTVSTINHARITLKCTAKSAPAGGAPAAAPEGGALAGPSAPTSTSTRWALVTP
jgi:hypothetical protein